MIRNISRSVASIPLSAIKDMAMRSARLENSVSLAWGLPSFGVPDPVRQALAREMVNDPDIGKYTLPDGLPELRLSISRTYEHATGCIVDPDQDVLVTSGNMQGISSLLRTLLDPGDEVIVTDPGFVSHIQQIRLCHGQPVFWALDEKHDWRLDPDALEELIGPKTRAIILVTPSNPTGAIFDKESLLATARIARDHGVLILLDDPYSGFKYRQSVGWFNLAEAEEYRENMIYLFTFSKVHAMSGFRLGYMVLPRGLKKEVLKVHDSNIICAPRASQVAGMAALENSTGHIERFTIELEKRLDLICQRLDRLPHVFQYIRPGGTYYVFPRIVAEHSDSYSFAVELLEAAGVSVTPGSAFGPSGESHVRMAFCVDQDTINLAFERMEARFGAS